MVLSAAERCNKQMIFLRREFPSSGFLLQAGNHVRFRQYTDVDVGIGGAVGGNMGKARFSDSSAALRAKNFPRFRLSGLDVDPVNLRVLLRAAGGDVQ